MKVHSFSAALEGILIESANSLLAVADRGF